MVETLPKNWLLVIEFYNILIPPIVSGYMVSFICIYMNRHKETVETEPLLKEVQTMAELAHKMGVIASPTFCSYFYMIQAYGFLRECGMLEESQTYFNNKIRMCFKVCDAPALKALIGDFREFFLWEENYRLIKRIYSENYIKNTKQPSMNLLQKL
jgi:hypothetical protein